MSSVSALLAQYNAVKSQIEFYTLEQIKWQGLHDNMTEKLSKMQKYEENWYDASDKFENSAQDEKAFASNGVTWVSIKTEKTGGNVTKGEDNKETTQQVTNKIPYVRKNGPTGDFKLKEYLEETDLTSMADFCVPQFDPYKLEEYANLDMEYDSQLTTTETMLQELKAQAEALKSATEEGAKDQGISGS